jgi:DNA-binding MarR family transcriptional regulator
MTMSADGMDKLPIGYLVKLVDEAFRYKLDGVLKVHSLTTATYAALHHLAASDEPMNSSALARASWVTPQTMHRLVKSLKDSGFIAIADQRGRALMLTLTKRGEQAYLTARKDVTRLERDAVAHLSTQEEALLRKLLMSCHGVLTGAQGAKSPE